MFIYHIIITIFITFSDALPDIFCDPSFSSITKFVNDSYFFVDGEANFWRVANDVKVRKELKIGKITDLRTEGTARLGDGLSGGDFKTFHLTYMIDFDGKCESVTERFYGLHFGVMGTSYTMYSNLKWSDTSWMKKEHMGNAFLQKANQSIDASKVINAILNFNSNIKTMLIIQEHKLISVYCDRDKDWQLYNGTAIQFLPSYHINYGAIFGGLVDNDNKILYLFPGQISSTGTYIRKSFHKCSYVFKHKSDPKITLNCIKQDYKSLCKVRNFMQKYGFILVTFGGILSIGLLITVCFWICYFCLKKVDNSPECKALEEDPSVNGLRKANSKSKSEPKPRVKPVLASERTFGKLKPELKLIRTIDFKANKK